MKRYVVLDPNSSDPTFGLVEDAVIVTYGDNAEADYIRQHIRDGHFVPVSDLLEELETEFGYPGGIPSS